MNKIQSCNIETKAQLEWNVFENQNMILVYNILPSLVIN